LLSFEQNNSTSQVSLSADAWGDLAVAAIALGLAPAVHLGTQDRSLPALARAKLAVTYAANQRRNETIASQLAELLAAYSSAGIDTIVLKGGYLAFQVYPDPALRGMSDLDLLFRPADLPRAEGILRSLGYEGKHKAAEEGPGIIKHTSTYKRSSGPVASTPNPYLSTGGDRHVDPHGTLEESWFGLRVDVTPGVWQRSRPILLVGQPACAMRAEDLLLHLGVHLVFHLLMGQPSLVQLYDLGVVAQRLDLDWDLLLSRSLECRAVPFLYAALHLSHRIFSAPVPVEILFALHDQCPPDLATYIADLGLEEVLQRTQRPPLVSIPQRIARGFRDRRDTARWATTWSDKWGVWRTALSVSRTDTGRLMGQSLRARFSRQTGATT
jgi:hypothetical protein